MTSPVWMPGELNKLDRLLARGMSMPKIAAELPGRSVHSVRAKITALRIEAMKKGNFEFIDKRNRWTPEKLERLRVLLGEGRPFREVAGILGQSKKSCQHKASQLGIRLARIRAMQKCIPTMQKSETAARRPNPVRETNPPKRETIPPPGETPAPRSETLGESAGVQRHNLPWTKEEEQRLLALATHRLSYAEIGKKLNRTAISVEVRLKALSRGVVGSKKHEGIERPCLCCKNLFFSEGPHNRLCSQCRQIDAGPEPVRIVLR